MASAATAATAVVATKASLLASSTSSTSSLSSSPSRTARLKRLSNTDAVFTVWHSAEGEKYRCKACSRSFNLKCTLLRHVRHQHQGRFVPHPCPQCGQVFKRTDHLKVHLKKIHQIETLSKIAGRKKAKKEAELAMNNNESLNKLYTGGSRVVAPVAHGDVYGGGEDDHVVVDDDDDEQQQPHAEDEEDEDRDDDNTNDDRTGLHAGLALTLAKEASICRQ